MKFLEKFGLSLALAAILALLMYSVEQSAAIVAFAVYILGMLIFWFGDLSWLN